MGYAGRHNIYEATIRRMVTQALEAQEQQFRQEHEQDPDEALLNLIRDWVSVHGYTPWPGELAGGIYLTERFGSWESALAAAGLPRPRGQNKPGTFFRVKEEEARQKEIYRQHKAEKRILAEKRRSQQDARKKKSEE